MKRYIQLTFLFLISTQVVAKDISTLYPYPKAAWNKQGIFTLTNSTQLVIPDNATRSELNSVAALQSAIKKQIGSSLSIVSIASYNGSGGIILGEPSTNNLLQNHLGFVTASGEQMPSAGGYVLDITGSEILIAGSDTDGTYNAISTFAQLLTGSGQTATISAAHVWDYPDYFARWVFSQHNLLVTQQLSSVESIVDTMALYKLNGLQQNDFKYAILQNMGPNYFQNVDSLKSHLLKKNVEMIPGVIGLGWSSGILYNDPNLAEGLPANATYILESDTGRLIPDTRTVLTNGDFESVTNNQFTGWNGGGSFYDGPNVSSFVDHSVFHGGTTSARCTNFIQGNAGGNCRFSKLASCDSNKSYSLSCWVRTQSLNGGTVQMLVLGGVSGMSLTSTQLSIPATTDWTRVEVNFNTLGNTSIRCYVGIWGGNTGTIWFDDFSIREAGLCNVLRRAGTPVTVSNKNTGHAYIEGVDYVKIVDPQVQAKKDSYFPYHTPPTFSRLMTGGMNNGDSIMISYYHPYAAVSDNQGNGSVMACVSEDTLYKILGDQVARVNALYQPSRFFMGHDEIRNMNHDKICTNLHRSPATLLSDNITKCHDLLRTTNPKADILMWSDMVDSLHNAHNNYYLIGGDLTGDWKNIPKDITIVNWNGGGARASLQFFEKNGFKQISSPYYDVGNTSTIRSWRIAQEGVSNVRGMMYTTWNSDYNFLRAFAYYSWGAGPNIIHTPLDTSVLNSSTFPVNANVVADPFDNTDAIVSVDMNIVDSVGTVQNILTLTSGGGGNYSAQVANFYQKGLRYFISATNKQGITRTLPTYILLPSGKTPAVPGLIAPMNKSADTSRTITFKWGVVPFAKNYIAEVSTSQTFSVLLVDSNLILSSFVKNRLMAGNTKYFWRVRAVNDAGVGAWSDVWSFTVACSPALPQLVKPINLTTINTDTVTLFWTLNQCDTTSDLQVSNDSLFTGNIADVKGLSQSSYKLTSLKPASSYFWHVRGSSLYSGSSGWTSTREFLTSPSKGITVQSPFELSLTNHPNPLHSGTSIDFVLPIAGFTTIRLYDLLGKELRIVASELFTVGSHSLTVDLSGLPSGNYICELRTPEAVISRQLQVIK